MTARSRINWAKGVGHTITALRGGDDLLWLLLVLARETQSSEDVRMGQANSGSHQLPVNFPDFLLAPSTSAAQLAGGRCILGDVFVLFPSFGAGSSPCLSWQSQSQDHRAHSSHC